MARVVKDVKEPVGVVQEHRHIVESAMMVLGDDDDPTGLKVGATIEDERDVLNAPVTIYPPTPSDFFFFRGKYVKIVLAPKGDHNPRHTRFYPSSSEGRYQSSRFGRTSPLSLLRSSGIELRVARLDAKGT